MNKPLTIYVYGSPFNIDLFKSNGNKELFVSDIEKTLKIKIARVYFKSDKKCPEEFLYICTNKDLLMIVNLEFDKDSAIDLDKYDA